MKTDAATPHSLVFWIMIAVPALAVIASFTTLALAIRGAEPELPASYHWEGAALDQDLQRLQAASRLGVTAQLQFEPDGTLALRTRFRDPLYVPPATLTLRVSHATLAKQDRSVTLQRDGEIWRARSNTLPAGHWLLELTDGRRWLLRREFSAPLESLELGSAVPSASPSQ